MRKTERKFVFWPDADIFEDVHFDYDTLRRRLREMAFLNRGISITLEDLRGDEPVRQNYCYEGGIKLCAAPE